MTAAALPPDMAAELSAAYGTAHGNFLRLIFADEVQLADEAAAEAYRWLAEKDRWAIQDSEGWYGWWSAEYCHHYRLGPSGNGHRDEVPEGLLRKSRDYRHPRKAPGCWTPGYNTVDDPPDSRAAAPPAAASADAALAAAFASLSREERDALWAWRWTPRSEE